MSWSSTLQERVRDFVTACTGGDWGGRAAQAQRLLEDLRRADEEALRARWKPRTTSTRPGAVDKSGLPFAPPRHATRQDRRDTRNERLAELRRVVMARARGRCEFACGVGEPGHTHHVLGGADRRAMESEHTLAGICEDCHTECNKSPAWAREQAIAWARRLYDAAAAAGDSAAAAGFLETLDVLEARADLAAAQAVPLSGGGRAS